MANRIKGITVEIGGSTTKLEASLKGVNKTISSTQTSLRDVNKLLKLDPTNTDLLKQKQEYLKEAIDATAQKLEEEKAALEQIKANNSTGEVTEDQRALEREIVETENKLKSLKDQYSDFGSVAGQKLQAVGQSFEDLGGKIEKTGETLTNKLTVPLVALGGASIAAFKTVDEGADTIVKKTGASGEALDQMIESMEEIATRIPTDFGTAGEAIGEVNTRFGLTGQELEDLSEKFIKFADLNDTNVSNSIDGVQKVMAAFGVDAQDAGLMLDMLNKVGQDTGINMDTLIRSLTTNAAALTEMGFSASDAAAFLGQCEVSGADTSAVMTGLKKALANAAKEGKPMSEALEEVQDAMLNAKTEEEGLQAAIDLFGAKAGPSIYNACKQGSLSFDELGTSLTDAMGSVDETFANTQDTTDDFKTAMNEFILAGKELGTVLLQNLAPILQKIAEFIRGVQGAWEELSPGVQDAIVKVGMVVAAIGPALIIIGKIIGFIGTVVSSIGSVIGAISSVIGSISAVVGAIAAAGTPIGWIVAAIAGVIAIIVAVLTHLDEVRAWINDFVSVSAEMLKGAIMGVMEFFGSMALAIGNALDSIGQFFENLRQNVTDKVAAIKEGASDKFESMKEAMRDKVDAAKQKVVDTFENIRQNMSDKVQTAKDTVDGIFDSIRSGIEDKINAARDAVGSAIDTIKGFFDFEWHLPELALPHPYITGSFSLNPPSVPSFGIDWYDKAMDKSILLDGATIFGAMGGKGLGGGETGKEIIMGLDYMRNLLGASDLFKVMTQMYSLLASWLPQMAKMNVVMDGNKVVGYLMPQIDKRLGQMTVGKMRYV